MTAIDDLLTAAKLIEGHSDGADDRCSGVTERLPEKRPLKRGVNGLTAASIAVAGSSRRCANKQSRAAHNELEKTRRANLRGCLEYLKEIVPAGSDTPRNTTLSLLTRARHYIQSLEQRDRALQAEKRRLQDQQRLMRRHLELLTARQETRKRSTSESSASTISVVADLEEESGECASPSSPVWLEYSPSAKPSISDSTPPLLVDLYADGLLPALPLFHPRLSVYPYLGVQTTPLHDQLLPHVPIVTASPMPLVMSSSCLY